MALRHSRRWDAAAGRAPRRHILHPALLITLGAVTDRPVKELIEQSQQLHFAVDFERSTQKALALQKVPNVLLGQHDAPANMRERDILRSPQRPDLAVAA